MGTGPRSVLKLKRVAARASQKLLDAKNLREIERRYQIWDMRKQGHSIRDISISLGVTDKTIRADLVTVAKRHISELSETVEESRQLQIERLDGMLKQYQPLAEAGNLSAAAMVLSIESRRSKLLALDVPETKKLDVTGIREYVGVNMDDV